jgi:hypothetical protein
MSTDTESAHPAARLVTDYLDPKNWIVATIFLLGLDAAGLAGVGWAMVIIFFSAVLPVLFIRFGMRWLGFSDRHLGERRHRLVTLAFITSSVTAGVVLMIALGAPYKMTGYIVGMLASAVALGAITLVWKISVHCAAASAAVLIVALTFGQYLLVGYAVVAVVAWSRVELRDHTVAQVIGGTVLGAMVAALTYLAVS